MGRFLTTAPPTPIKSIQSGYGDATSFSAGSGEDAFYRDITVAAVTTSKCVVNVHVSFPINTGTSTGITARLTSATNLRISSLGSGTISYRWTIVEHM